MKMRARWQKTFRKFRLTQWDTPMVRPQRFEIQFDVPSGVYFSKQTITGNVVLQVAEPLNLKGVKMRFLGECCIHFTDFPKGLENLRPGRKGWKEARRKPAARDSPVDSLHAKWTPGLNRHGGGLTNPGYIPDQESCDPGLEAGLRAQGPGRPPSYRPNSSESAWLEGTITGPRQHYRAQETYFDCEFYIYGHKYQKAEKEVLPAGLHEFPFAFSMPPNLPSSCNCGNGFIRYVALAILDRPTGADLVQKAGFTIHSILDLNRDVHASSAASGSDVKNLCCFCCKTGPITLAVHIPRRGYVPGEKILVSAEADNLSSKNTRRTRLQLVQVMKYIMPNGVKELEEERVLKEIVRGIIPPGESDVWENVAITVPPIVPANVHLTCRLLHVQYRLDMLLELSAPLSALQVSLPITIGTVPLRKRFSTFLPPGETRKPCRLPGIKYPDYPSYWFGECILGQECLETQYERVTGMQENYGPQFEPKTSFAPKYICYTEGNNVNDESRGRRLGQTIT